MAKYAYTSKPGNEYSLVLTGAAFIHIYYYRLFSSLPPSSIAKVDEYANCEDILVNFMVSHVTGKSIESILTSKLSSNGNKIPFCVVMSPQLLYCES